MLKRFISYYKPHLPMFLLDMFCAVIVAGCNLFYPMIAKNIIGEYLHDDTPRRLIVWSSVLLGVYLVKLLCNYIVGYYGHEVGIRIQYDMRRDLFRKYEKLPFSYFDNARTGELLSRLTSDLFEISELAHHGPEDLFLSALMLTGSFILLWSISWKLTLVLIAVIPLIVLFTGLSRKRLHAAMKNSRKQMAIINAAAENSIGGVRETKSFAAEDEENRKFDKENNRFVKIRRDAVYSLGLFDAVMAFLSDLLYLSTIFVGGLFLYYGEIDAVGFATFLLFIGMFLNPINRFASLFQQLEDGMSGFARFCEIMELPEEADNGKIELTDIRGDVVFDNISFDYELGNGGKKPVISGLSLSIPAGQTLALVGPSGGGKTTLCNLIPRFYNLSSGRITIDGVDVNDITLHSLRKTIGSVSQNVFLFDGTIRENILYGSEGASEEDMIRAAKSANIHDYVMTLSKGYDTEVGERGVKLSGGQKQRVAIARVFLKDPKLLILDEATSALDNVTEMQIQQSLEELAKGRTVIVVAHRLSTVKNADKIAVITKDGIAELGTHDELITKEDGIYRTLYAYQFKNLDTALLPTL